jgi:glycosyltransferase involved in cell wall biosynthesis
VVTVHGILGEDAKHQTGIKTRTRAALTGRLIERDTVRRAAELISISPYVTDYYGKSISGRVHEISNAIAPDYFDLERAPERGRLLFAGRVIKRKGVVDLVRAMALNDGFPSTLVIAGGAPDRSYEVLVRQEVARLGLADQVQFAGLLSENALLDEFRRAEALVLPSYQETAPMVIQQAMAAGLPVLASNICGIPYQIKHGATGLLFDAGNIPQLASLIARLEAEPSLSQVLGRAAKASAVSRYHATTVARATRAAYATILGVENELR